MLHEFMYTIWTAPCLFICGKVKPENHGREEGRVEEQDLRGAHKIQDFFNFFICETFNGSLLELNISQF